MGQPEALLIFGPGEAKLQLQERFSSSTVLSDDIAEIETTDKLTDPQIVVKVKEHYGIRSLRTLRFQIKDHNTGDSGVIEGR